MQDKFQEDASYDVRQKFSYNYYRLKAYIVITFGAEKSIFPE